MTTAADCPESLVLAKEFEELSKQFDAIRISSEPQAAPAFDDVELRQLLEVLPSGAKPKSANQAAPELNADSDDDPIENVLTGQRLKLYRCLKTRQRRTSFDTLAKLKCWRFDEPYDETIVKALTRLQAELNNIPVPLVIEAKDRQTYLDK